MKWFQQTTTKAVADYVRDATQKQPIRRQMQHLTYRGYKVPDDKRPYGSFLVIILYINVYYVDWVILVFLARV